MKKLIVLASLFVVLFTTTASAQGGPGGDPAVMKQRMIERVKPQLIEKTKITDEQANKVLDIYFEAQQQRRALRTDAGMSDDDKTKKTAAIQEDTNKKYKAIPLTDDQVKSVNAFFDDMRKNMQQRKPDGGNK